VHFPSRAEERNPPRVHFLHDRSPTLNPGFRLDGKLAEKMSDCVTKKNAHHNEVADLADLCAKRAAPPKVCDGQAAIIVSSCASTLVVAVAECSWEPRSMFRL